jgi:DNA-binding response OmpR family regulator
MKRALVCDDDIVISEVIALVLTDNDWEVYTLPDCNNIISKIESIKPSIIFMDNKIPEEGGIIATQTIKKHHKHCKIPVIYFTANEDIDLLAEQAGADFTLQKPFNLEQLEAIVEKALNTFKERQPGTFT